MPKKKSSSRKNASAKTKRKRTVASKQAKKPAKKKVRKSKKGSSAPKASGKTVKRKVAKKKVSKKSAAKKKTASLGRPRVTGDAKLDQFFKRDYQAREIFEFLGVTTVKELESHRPAEIVDRLTSPVVQAVERIRIALALNNRCLAGDRKFALKFQARMKSGK